jgi:hypothetical protein
MQSEAIIIDPKTRYLIKTLSRTQRKDYENYVINAIWHRLGNPNVEVVSQQYVLDTYKKSGRSHFFIDLYFPALNLGIECDEAYHADSGQAVRDQQREVTIFDVLYKISADNYEAIHIRVTGKFGELEDAIMKAVERIQQRVREVNPPLWQIETPETYYKNKATISINDRKGFSSINKTCNVLFAAGRKEVAGGASRAYFSLPAFTGTELEGYKLWFPKLAIPVMDEQGNQQLIAATHTGWHNQLSEGGSVIIERNDKNQSYIPDLKKRIVFMKYKDPLGYNEDKFVGIFQHDRIEGGSTYFRRIVEECILLRK